MIASQNFIALSLVSSPAYHWTFTDQPAANFRLTLCSYWDVLVIPSKSLGTLRSAIVQLCPHCRCNIDAGYGNTLHSTSTITVIHFVCSKFCGKISAESRIVCNTRIQFETRNIAVTALLDA